MSSAACISACVETARERPGRRRDAPWGAEHGIPALALVGEVVTPTAPVLAPRQGWRVRAVAACRWQRCRPDGPTWRGDWAPRRTRPALIGSSMGAAPPSFTLLHTAPPAFAGHFPGIRNASVVGRVVSRLERNCRKWSEISVTRDVSGGQPLRLCSFTLSPASRSIGCLLSTRCLTRRWT